MTISHHRLAPLLCFVTFVVSPSMSGAQVVSAQNGNPIPDKFKPVDPEPGVQVDNALFDLLQALEAYRVGVLPNPCDMSSCGIQSVADECAWQRFADANSSGECASLSTNGPNGLVDQRLCELGIFLDGDVSAAIAAGASMLVDQVLDAGGASPGPDGDAEEPRLLLNPNGINVGHSLFLYMPDTDPLPGPDHDNSFLYVAWDISDFDGPTASTPSVRPVPYDSDDNGRACTVQDGTTGNEDLTGDVFDDRGEGYSVELQSCANLAIFNPASTNPNGIGTDQDARVLTTISPPIPLFMTTTPAVLGQHVEIFPTARPSDFPPFPPSEGYNAFNPTNGCIDTEQQFCAADNNVEMVIKRVESHAAFGPNQRTRRFALARLVGRMGAVSFGDFGDEEFANVALRTSLPGIEVVKEVRCADSLGSVFSSTVTAIPGAQLEYRVTITNTGNENLGITVDDQMAAVGTQAGLFTCAPQCETLVAELTRGGVTTPITAANAAGFGLDAGFFADSCADPDLGFLGAIRNQLPIHLGMLEGVKVTRVNRTCQLQDGDVLVVRFFAMPEVADPIAFCTAFDDPDCTNAVSVTATFDSPAAFTLGRACTGAFQCDDGLYCNGTESCSGSVCVAGAPPCGPGGNCDDFVDTCGLFVGDIAGAIDTPDETTAGEDNNSTSVDLLCREIDFAKQVGFSADSNSFTTADAALRIPNIPPGGFIDVEYRYSGTNSGELAEDVTIADAFLCADIAASGATLLDCPMCPAGEITLTVPAGGAYVSTCGVRFTSQESLRDFIERDGLHPACTDPDIDRYRNCADVSALPNPAELVGVCGTPAPLTRDSFATIENHECVLDVIKEVRCLPDCTTAGLDDDAGWLAGPDELVTTADACVQYRVTVTNISTAGVAVCALRVIDEMFNSGAFADGPTDVTVQSPTACPNFATEFNWDGLPVQCTLDPPLLPGEQVVVKFQGRLAPPGSIDFDDDPVNRVRVLGVPEDECGGALFFSCGDVSSIGLDVRACETAVTKDATCGDPRAPGAVFDNLVDVLPGAEAGFRIRMQNLGEVDLAQVTLTDVLGCADWFIPGSVVADIDGTDVTACVCPGGVCASVADLNGTHDLALCPPGALPAGSVLTVTFQVLAPVDFDTSGTPVDCTNTVTVQGTPAACHNIDENPCPENTDDAQINVLIPGVVCDETICADLNADGLCDVEYAATNSLTLACDVDGAFPLTLAYEFTVNNTGETPLADAEVCKPGFVADAIAAGILVGPCDLCDGPCDGVDDDCASVGPIAAGGSAVATCALSVPSRAAWELFAVTDGGVDDCHNNSVQVTGFVDTSGLCAEGADTSVLTTCDADVCIAPPCVLDVEKSVRCVENCGDLTPVGADGAALPALPGATVEFEISAINAGGPGDPAICSLEFTDTLVGPFDPCSDTCTAQLLNGAGDPQCALPPGWLPLDGTPAELDLLAACGALLTPGDRVVVRCAGVVLPSATSGETIGNSVTVRGAAECPAGDDPVYCCDDDAAASVEVLECGFGLVKDVTCGDPRAAGAVFNDLADVLPGAEAGFRVRVTNTGDVDLTEVTLTDVLDCADWFIPASVVADVDGTDVSACICPGGVCNSVNDLNGTHDLTSCPPGAVPPGGVLTVTFRVRVPADFETSGTAVDCTNTITVDGTTDICAAPGGDLCPELVDSASINVLIPDVYCSETICADLDGNGLCDLAPTENLDLACDAALVFPISLIYSFEVTNPGEAPLADAEVCKPDFVADAIIAGIFVGPCDLCDGACDGIGDECASLGPVPQNGSVAATCVLTIPSRAAWELFAGSDGVVDDCHTNSVQATGFVDTTGLCAEGAESTVESSCGAQVCIAPPCALDVEKSFRCLDNCADLNPLGAEAGTLEAQPGATVEFEILTRNSGLPGGPAICSLEFIDVLIGQFEPCPDTCVVQVINGAGDPVCAVPPGFVRTDGVPFTLDLAAQCGVLLDPGDEVVVVCAGTIPADATGEIANAVQVRGAPSCPPAGPTYCCADSAAATVDIDTCGLEISKQVTCDDPALPGAVFDPDLVQAVPGATVGFAYDVCNTGNVPLVAVELTDSLSCAGWFVPGSVTAFIEGDDVIACICPQGGCDTIDDLNGLKDFELCTPDAIPTNGCLTITFEVAVPADFSTIGTPIDCTNLIAVEGVSDVCADPDANPCPLDVDTAGIDVLVPGLECQKRICADINNDGDCLDSGGLQPDDIPFTTDLQMPCDVNDAFPIRLIYELATFNPGETTIVSPEVCDPDLVADAVAAGAIVGPCVLCDDAAPCDGINDECVTLPSLAPDSSVTVFCEIEFPTLASWYAFAGLDGGDENCHSNGLIVSSAINTTGLCSRDADLALTSACEAQACLAPPCDLETTKEVRCVESCADRTPISAGTNALPATPGATVEFEIAAINAGDPGDPALCRLRFEDSLTGPFTPCANFCTAQVLNGVDDPVCALPPDWLPIDGSAVELDLLASCGVALAPGDRVVIRCAGVIPADAAGGASIANEVTIEGASVCPPGGDAVYCCTDTDEAVVNVDTCSFTLTKEITCDDPAAPGAVYADQATVFPGALLAFRVDVCNSGDLPLTVVEIADTLNCPTWFVANSVVCDVDGTDVTACVCPQGGCDTPADLNGAKDLTACAAEGIATNGCLTCTFDVQVPADFPAAGTAIDCVNTVTVGALSDVCGATAGDVCGELVADATIDVRTADHACEKTVSADYGNDGGVDASPTTDLEIEDTAQFPIRLIFEMTLRNPGESDLVNAQVCDPSLVAHAVSAGIAVGPCDLCAGPCDGAADICANLGAVPAGGGSGTATCELIVANAAQLAQFTALDGGDPEEYLNVATFSADADASATCGTPPALATQNCSARITRRTMPPLCYPRTKATFTVWNQNEVKFTGLHRCITLWDETPFSLYGQQLGAPNHLLRMNLQTDKGKAQINGLASVLCTDSALESVAAPLIGVAQKRLTFNGVPTALTGMPLIGVGAEEGFLRYDLGVPGGSERPEAGGFVDDVASIETDVGLAAPRDWDAEQSAGSDSPQPLLGPLPAGTPRGATSQKGSLLVYPKIELRWREVSPNVWQLVQDTFIELTNDYPADVLVQMYFVHGDQPILPGAIPGERPHPGCNWADVQIELTANEPSYWSSGTGLPKGVSPFTALDPGTPPGRPALDGTSDRVLRGYLLAWAVRYVSVGALVEQHEIAWNHLSGSATLVNYAVGDAWTYTPWAFQTVNTAHGLEPDAQPGNLRLDGIEYQAAPDLLLLDFYGTGSTVFSRGATSIVVDTDLTLLPMLQDVRQR